MACLTTSAPQLDLTTAASVRLPLSTVRPALARRAGAHPASSPTRWPAGWLLRLALPLLLAGPAAALAQAPAQAQAQAQAQANPTNPAGIDWQAIQAAGGRFSIARTETTVGQFRRFVQAIGLRTLAERRGGGQVYEAGWVQQPGWTWRRPFGGPVDAADDEPAVHLAFDEAQAFCRWAGGRLPSDAEWLAAAYTETRASPPPPLASGRSYPFPTGDSPQGAQCLGDCGPQAQARALRHGARLARGDGHARAGSTPAGVNGLHEMGGNAWEWVDEPRGAGGAVSAAAAAGDTGLAGSTGSAERRTRGGSWWYGAAQMRADHLQSKPADTTVVYLGFRCARQP